ncbi:helix-turn-helix domain-containing protein [Sphingomonas sp. UNC305MFCol5.2]|uniref:helix-turn-helix domain-containing protein n=1 Tax=Sphingomonas sp. UNC305MFCol5.2 TaxID=1449076 RepID=UPI0004A76D37|nr:helix-turn-helix transcriptional regulator [Sphingomonas sp. UNC305MFCol5.2]
MVQDTARKTRGRTAQAEESYEVIKAQEDLIVDVQTGIARALRERGLKQIDLAERLGVSQARVSQMFGDGAHNLTLRTLAKIYYVLGARCQLVEAPARNATSVADATCDVPTDTPTEPVELGPEQARYRFHRPASAVQLAAKAKFVVRRGCAARPPLLTQHAA